MEYLLIAAIVWGIASAVVIRRLAVLLRRLTAELEEARARARIDLEEHHRSLADLLAAVREFMQQSTATLEDRAEQLRALIAQAERVGGTAGAQPTEPARRPAAPTAAEGAAPRRRDVVQGLERGETVEAIARRLGVSQREVELIARLHGRRP